MGNTFNMNRWEGNVYIYKGGKVDENDKTLIQHVKIHESVTIIHDEAFYECRSLQTVEFSINNKLKKIGNGSFCGCSNISSINLQDTQIETIGDGTFGRCHKLVTIYFPSTVRRIGKSCFCACHQLKVVDLSNANFLETIEDDAFVNCSTLTTVILPATTSRIGEKSFSWCNALESVDLRTTCITEIGEGAFWGCTNLKTFHFPTTIKRIRRMGFRDCEKLSSLDLQMTHVESIDYLAFYGCCNLGTVNFPKTLRGIGCNSFGDCSKLEHLNLRGTSIEKIGRCAFMDCTNLTTVVGISTAYQEITDDRTFHSGDMKLPASLVEIGKNSFSYCPKLKNSIDNNRIHYYCDINRGGGKFLERKHHHPQDNDGSTYEHVVGKVNFYSSLWPLILYRVMNEMELPNHRICRNDDDLMLYTTAADPLQRRASVVYYLLVHGVAGDLQSRNHVLECTNVSRQATNI